MHAPAQEGREAHAHEINEKAGSFSDTCERWPVQDDIKKMFSAKSEWGKTIPVNSAELSG